MSVLYFSQWYAVMSPFPLPGFITMIVVGWVEATAETH
jgi:hypothetical protein